MASLHYKVSNLLSLTIKEKFNPRIFLFHYNVALVDSTACRGPINIPLYYRWPLSFYILQPYPDNYFSTSLEKNLLGSLIYLYIYISTDIVFNHYRVDVIIVQRAMYK